MKMNTKLVLVLTFMLVVSSCNDSDIIVENANSGISIDKSTQLNLTPDEKLHKEQSSLENMLMDQIIYRDSAYILNMSKEEAIDLTIPDSLYVHYLKIVDDLNTLKSTKLMLITILCLILSSLSGCKKDIVESLLKNNSYVECIINGKCARGEGLRTMFEAPTSFHMNYSYYDDGSFTFNIAKGINDKEGGNYRIYISVTQKGLPQLGEKYYFKEHIDNNGPFDFEDECYIASIEVTPYLYQCSDTTLIPKSIRKKKIILKTDIVNKGYIEFTNINVDKGEIFGLFNFETEVTSKRVPQASYKASVTEGKFEGYNIERNRTFYTSGLFDYIL